MDNQNKRSVFYVLATIQVTLIFTISLIFVPLPQIALEMGLQQADLLLITAAYGLPYSGLLLFGGRLTDKYDSKKVFIIGSSIFALASLLIVFAGNFELLVGLRFLQGIGGSLIAPASIGILKKVFTDESQFNNAMAHWGAFSVLGAALGPVLGGAVIAFAPWRWLFLIPFAISVIAILFVKHRLEGINLSNVNTDQLGLDIKGTILATLGISVSSYALIVVDAYSWGSPQVIVPLVTGMVFIVAFYFIEKRVDTPLLPPDYLLDKTRSVGLISIFMAAAASGLSMFFLTLFLQQVKEWTPLETAGAYLPFAIVLVVMNKYAMLMVRKWGTLITTLVGLSLSTLAFILLTFIDYDSSFVVDLLPAHTILPVGLSMIFSGSAVLSTANVRPSEIGLAGGVMNTSMELGPTVGLAVFMSVAAFENDMVSGYSLAFKTAGVAFALMSLLLLYKTFKTK
ncbi:MFS transporter [Arenibacter sp. M-2]|uniref:MFS transporter n=1 Tax=Arenibacter sp. M-2 TaxID=3053612 RepID=UPI002570152F|nr:MFS transporter [Arenibacter sp. M-2]MDL5511106.1 MFS transporter [Arenibacter sp. M-2]